jgi:hypothetical protein
MLIFVILAHVQSLLADGLAIGSNMPKLSSGSRSDTKIQIYNPPDLRDPQAAFRDFKDFNPRKPILYGNPALNRSNLTTHQQIKSMGGTNGAGGGGGVACLKDPALPLSLKNIKDVFTYDYWEWNLTKNPKLGLDYIQPFHSENLGSYLTRIINQNSLMKRSRFHEILEAAVQEVMIQFRSNPEQLFFENTAYRNDRGKLFDGEESYVQHHGCVLVQLAWRSLLEGSDDQYSIRFDKRLFELLGVLDPTHRRATKILNQASLILHEALYLIGERLGQHPTSYHVRFMVNYLMIGAFSNQFSFLKFRYTLYSSGFDHFYHLVGSSSKAKDKRARREAYLNLVEQFGNMRKVIYPVLSEQIIFESQFVRNPYLALRSKGVFIRQDVFEPNYNTAFAEVMMQAIFEIIIPSLSEADALVLLGRIYADELDSYVSSPVNFESLLIDDELESMTLRFICGQDKTYDRYVIAIRKFVNVLREKSGTLCANLAD